MRVLITGAGGFIGQYLSLHLAAAEYEVLPLTRQQGSAQRGKWLQADVTDASQLQALPDFDAVVHLAGLADASASVPPARFLAVNALGAANMLECARQRSARFILASSQRVYAGSRAPLKEESPLKPVDAYGYSKMCAEIWLALYRERYGLSATALRFFSVYGPGQKVGGGISGVVSILVQRALTRQPLWVDSEKLRDFVYVDDVSRAIELTLRSRSVLPAAINVGTGVPTTLARLASTVLELSSSDSSLELRSGGGPGDYVADITRAREALGFEPSVELASGLRMTIDAHQA